MQSVPLTTIYVRIKGKTFVVGVAACMMLLNSISCGLAAAETTYFEEILSTISRRSEWPSARFALAEAQFHSKQWKKAVEEWEKLVIDHQYDPLAPKALWRIVVTQSGPLNDKRAAIKTTQRLIQTYPKDLYGEQAFLGKAYLFYWSKNKARAKEAADRYLQMFPHGHFTKAANQLLTDLK